MNSLKTTFKRVAFGTPCSDLFWLLIWIIIIDDRQRRERRKKRRRFAQAQCRPRPPAGPRPY